MSGCKLFCLPKLISTLTKIYLIPSSDMKNLLAQYMINGDKSRLSNYST